MGSRVLAVCKREEMESLGVLQIREGFSLSLSMPSRAALHARLGTRRRRLVVGSRCGRTGRKPEVPGLYGLSTPPHSTPPLTRSVRLFPPSSGHWPGNGSVTASWASRGEGPAVVFRCRTGHWRGRGILACAQTQAERLSVCMLICLHHEKEIAEIPKKIASCQRLIVNSDRKVPRDGRKPG